MAVNPNLSRIPATWIHGVKVFLPLVICTMAMFSIKPVFGQEENVTWLHVFHSSAKFERFEGRGFLCGVGSDKYRAKLIDRDLTLEAQVHVHEDDKITILFRSTDPGWQKLFGRATVRKYDSGASSFELFGMSADGAYVALRARADGGNAKEAIPTCRK